MNFGHKRHCLLYQRAPVPISAEILRTTGTGSQKRFLLAAFGTEVFVFFKRSKCLSLPCWLFSVMAFIGLGHELKTATASRLVLARIG